MLLADLPRTLLRRWYVTVAGVVLTIGLVVVAMMLVPSSSRITASVLLLPPRASAGTLGNPYLGLGGLKQPVDVLVRAMTAQDAVAGVSAQWSNVSYTVEPDYATNGPILVLSVDAPDAESAVAATRYLLELAPKTLDNLQAGLGVRPNARITSMVLTKDTRPVTIRKAQLRAVVIAAGAGLALTVLAAGAVDGLARRRSPRRDRPEKPRRMSSDEVASNSTPDVDADAWWKEELSIAVGAGGEPRGK